MRKSKAQCDPDAALHTPIAIPRGSMSFPPCSVSQPALGRPSTCKDLLSLCQKKQKCVLAVWAGCRRCSQEQVAPAAPRLFASPGNIGTGSPSSSQALCIPREYLFVLMCVWVWGPEPDLPQGRELRQGCVGMGLVGMDRGAACAKSINLWPWDIPG